MAIGKAACVQRTTAMVPWFTLSLSSRGNWLQPPLLWHSIQLPAISSASFRQSGGQHWIILRYFGIIRWDKGCLGCLSFMAFRAWPHDSNEANAVHDQTVVDHISPLDLVPSLQ